MGVKQIDVYRVLRLIYKGDEEAKNPVCSESITGTLRASFTFGGKKGLFAGELELSATIFCVRFFVVGSVYHFFFAIADGAYSASVYTDINQVITYSNCSAVTQCEVVLYGTSLVTVPFYLYMCSRLSAEIFCNLLNLAFCRASDLR